MSDNVCEAFATLCNMGIALGAAPMNKHAGCWEHQVDKQWWVAFNGHPEAKKTSNGQEVDPFHCYVEYNGWPAGVFTPYGGVIAAGEGANENTFIAAMVRAEAEALGCRLPTADDQDDYSITIGLAG
jgi:hypothetical protein